MKKQNQIPFGKHIFMLTAFAAISICSNGRLNAEVIADFDNNLPTWWGQSDRPGADYTISDEELTITWEIPSSPPNPDLTVEDTVLAVWWIPQPLDIFEGQTLARISHTPSGIRARSQNFCEPIG